jgi:prophage regulatory protein
MSERILRLPAVKALTGRCRSSIYNDIKAGIFPAPIKLGARASGWLESEIEGWIAGRTADSRRCQKTKDAQ